jgi:hypothetical protein
MQVSEEERKGRQCVKGEFKNWKKKSGERNGVNGW